jgi:hypothetical protein
VLLSAVIVQDGEGNKYPCVLIGFGGVACGKCNYLLPVRDSLSLGLLCTKCGAEVVEIDERGVGVS